MKKRILIVLAILVLFSLTVLAACDTHEHEYSWKSDENGHWQECACSDKTDKVAHADGNADGKCDTCGYNMHAHAYEWKSDAVNHWEECACGDKKAATPHVDVKNNETQAEGADGKCDVCSVEVYVVSYDMQGHGVAPQAQLIAKNGKAAAPAAPADDDAWSFGGWYKEAACENAFDFAAEAITANTTVYAKWTEDETEGASKAHAYALTLGEDSLQSIAKDQVVYFVYTAQENGRYTISLGLGPISQKCTYTTDKTGETIYNAENGQVNIDLAAEAKVYIMLTCAEELDADAMASVMIASCTGGDALPADLFPAGEYTDGNYLTFEFNRETMKISYLDKEHSVSYIGGEYNNKLVATIAGGYISEDWTITPNEDGSYTLLADDGWWPSTKTVHYVEPQAPVALSAIVGYYEPTESAYISELYIYAGTSETETSVLVLQSDSYRWYSAQYDTAKNRLTFDSGNSVVSLNLNEENEIVSLSLGGVTYEFKGELGIAPPAKLDIADGSEYNGQDNTLTATTYGQNLNSNAITVMGYAEDTGVYTVVVNENGEFVTYKITISQDGKTITLCDAEGEELDTLTKFEWISHDLPATEATLTVTADEFQNNLYLYTVKQTGWYSFSGIGNGAEVYYSLNENDYTDTYGARKAENGKVVYLVADGHVAVKMEEPADLSSIAIAPAQAPATQSNPQVIENGQISLDVVDNSTYYFTYTASHAGTYLVKAYYNDSEYNVYFSYTINGEECGNEVASIALTEGDLTINIQIPCQGEVEEGEMAWTLITIVITEDYSADATDVTWSDTLEDESLVLSATAASNANYHIESNKGQDVIVTGSAEFTVKLQNGRVISSEENGEEYSAIIRAIDLDGSEIYFRLESATEQDLTLTQVFEKGSEGYPLEVTIAEGVGTVEIPAVAAGRYQITVYFTVEPGIYKISAPEDTYVELYLNEDYIRAGQVIIVKEGDVLICSHNYNTAVILTLTVATEVFNEEQIGTYKGTTSVEFWGEIYNYDITLTFDKYGAGTYALDQGYGADPSNISISKNEDGTYSFIYNDMFTVTFSFGANGLEVEDEDLGEFTLEKIVVSGPITYAGIIGEGTDFQRNVTIVISGDWTSVVYTVTDDFGGEPEISRDTLSSTGSEYSFTSDAGDEVSFTVSEDGSTIELVDEYYGAGTLTKQA